MVAARRRDQREERRAANRDRIIRQRTDSPGRWSCAIGIRPTRAQHGARHEAIPVQEHGGALAILLRELLARRDGPHRARHHRVHTLRLELDVRRCRIVERCVDGCDGASEPRIEVARYERARGVVLSRARGVVAQAELLALAAEALALTREHHLQLSAVQEAFCTLRPGPRAWRGREHRQQGMPSRRGADRTLLQEAHREAALCVARSLSINGCSCTRPEARLPWHAEEKFAFLQLPRRDAAVASDHPVARSDHRLMAVHALRGYPRGVPSQRFFVDELHRSYFTVTL